MSTNQLEHLVPSEVLHKIVNAALSDPEFEAAFLASPQEAYRARFHEELLPGDTIEVRRQEDGSVLFFIPRLQQGIVASRRAGEQGYELSDKELDLVIGGATNQANCALQYHATGTSVSNPAALAASAGGAVE